MRTLGDHPTLRDALIAAGIAEARWPAFERAIAALVDSEMLGERAHSLVEQLKGGLDAPICLTWELTYACNLQCVHCLSSSGRRDPAS